MIVRRLKPLSCALALAFSGIAGAVSIPEIQGNAASSPLVGQVVNTEGVVTQLNNNGFYLQDPVGDGDAATSDGIFVFTSSAPTVSVGDVVSITAEVAEYNTGSSGNAVTLANPLTELADITKLDVLSTGSVIAPTTIIFPEAAEGDLERHEGMLVRIDTPLVASQNFFQGRYGQVTLAAGTRLTKPTNLYRASTPEALALAADNARRRIVLDDGTSSQNPSPIPYIGEDNTLRAGDTLPGLVGVIDYGLATNDSMGLADYRIHPAEPVVFERVNARPVTPPAVGGNVRVASFNVLNYFTTLDQSGAACFPSQTRSDCRGADSASEFVRQQDKIVSALVAIDADVVGLIEIENNGEVAVDNLVEALNASLGGEVYASVGLPDGGTGTDAIRVAMIYKPARLARVGNAISDVDPVHNRPPLAQSFAAANGETFSLVVNHFKSKGSCPSAGDPDADQGDGQGCWNVLRQQQATALGSFVQSLQTLSGDPDVIVMGDLNSYGREDPVASFLDAGYVDLLSEYSGNTAYSFVFDGEAGYLDHALAVSSFAGQVAAAATWAINADEPSVIDYNTEFKPQDFYAVHPYRASDHDPVLVGLNLLKRIGGSSGRDKLSGTPGDDLITGGSGADTLDGGEGSDVFAYASLRDASDVVTDFVPGTDRLDLDALLASVGGAPDTALALGVVRIVDTPNGAGVRIDVDGLAGAGTPRTLVLLRNVSAADIDPARDLGL
jgi:predicted extracellular nuclease